MNNDNNHITPRLQIVLTILATVVTTIVGIFSLLRSDPSIIVNLANLSTSTPFILEPTTSASPISTSIPEKVEIQVTRIVTAEITRVIEVTRIALVEITVENTPYPTYTPIPTGTPYPTYTSYPVPTPIIIIATPTNTPVPTSTPGPTPTPKNTGLTVGEYFTQGSIELKVESVEFTYNSGLTVYLFFAARNISGNTISFTYGCDNFQLKDNLGNRFECYLPNNTQTAVIESGQLESLYHPSTTNFWYRGDYSNPNVTQLSLTVTKLSGISYAEWIIPVNH